jgi:hypothetical protein
MDSGFPSQLRRIAVRFRNADLGPADSILIEIGEDLVISFETSAVPIPVPTEVASPSHSPTLCWTCNRPGHNAWQCLSGSSPLHGACYECGSPDHHALACPIPSGTFQNALTDSYVCNIHDIPRGYLNIMKDGKGGWRCKPDSECTRCV